MDFKSLINKIDSMDSPVDLPKAPTLPKSVQLNEDAELRVLSGRSTVLAETELMEKAVSKSQQKAAGAALAAKRGNGKAVGASKDMMKMSVKELEKIAGTKHKGLPEKKDESVSEAAIDDFLDKKNADKNKDDTGRRKHSGSRYGGAGQKDDAEDDKPEAKKGRKTAKESIELDIEEFNDTFSQMVEAAKKAPAKKAAVKKTDAKGAMNNMFGGGANDLTKNLTVKKKDEKVKEGAKPDFLDLDGDGDTKEPMKKAAADKKKGAVGKKDEKVAEAKSAAQKAAQEKFKAMVGKKKGNTSKKTEESKMMPKGKKRPVKESTERKLSFKQMVKLVQESGGQQQIDPKDQELFAWAQRVARTKLGEDAKAEIYAGLVYERMGGRFQMYDVLSENTVVRVNESRTYNLPLRVSGLDVMKRLPEDAIPRFIETKLGLPEGSMYFDGDDLVLIDQTIAQARETVSDMLEKTKQYIERNPDWEDGDMSDMDHSGSDSKLRRESAGGRSLDYDSVDLGSLEVDGIDYRDAPEFSDAYFSDGTHKDGTPLEDWELEALTGDYDLLNQYVVDAVY